MASRPTTTNARISGTIVFRLSPPSSADSTGSQPPPATAKARVTALTRTLTGTLAFLGTSIVTLEANPGADGSGSGTTGGPTAEPAATAEAGVSPEDDDDDDDDEVVRVLKRAHDMLKVEMAAVEEAEPAVQSDSAATNLTGGESRGVEEIRRQTAKVLDTLSEAYASRRHWEQARCGSWRLTTSRRTRWLRHAGALSITVGPRKHFPEYLRVLDSGDSASA